MALNATPITSNPQAPVAVEISDRRLPIRMRLDALRISARWPRTGSLRQFLMAKRSTFIRLLGR
jgi:hypothetical protein